MTDRGALWAVAGPLIALKIWAIVLLVMFAPWESLMPIVATTWPWVAVGMILVASPALAWWRLVRARARRSRLVRSEWMGERPTQSVEVPHVFVESQWPRGEAVSPRDGGD